jgi:exopolysaccharide biosynthesis polyprenyl glycosylphosphotransferase
MLTREGREAADTEPSAPLGRSEAGRRYERLKYGVAATDAISVVAAMMLTAFVRHGTTHAALGGPFFLFVGAPLVYLSVFASFGLYRLTRLYPAEEFRRIIQAVSLAVSAMVLLGFWTKNAPQRLSVALIWAFSLLFSLATRRLWHARMTKLRRTGRLTFRTLVVGTNEEARRLAHMMSRDGFGYRAIGLVRTDFGPHEADGLPVWGDVARLEQAITASGAECVFVASSAVTQEEMARVTKVAREGRAEVRMSSMISDIMSTRISVQPLGNVVTLSLKPAQLSGFQDATKRIMDVTLSSLALLVTLPVTAVIALALKLTSRGPIFYRQERVGQHGRAFSMLKFRTMVQGAEAMLDSLKDLNEATGPLFKLRDDPRITTVGRLLRRFSMDELPQFWNVLRGDMSVVGPRPPLQSEVALYEDWHHGRLEVRPGITGLWQVRGRSQLPFDDYVRLDLYYIENWSLAFDLFILIKTVPAVLTGKGAF